MRCVFGQEIKTRHWTRCSVCCAHLSDLKSAFIESSYLLDLSIDRFLRYFSIKMLFAFLASQSSHTAIQC